MWEKSKTFSRLYEAKKALQKSIREANGEELEDDELGDDMEGTGEGMGDDAAMDDSSTTPEEEAPDNAPEDQAEPETGIFISDNQKASIAKSLLNALMAKAPEAGAVPQELLNVTVANADQVIQFVQQYLTVAQGVDAADENNPNSLVSQIKDII